MRLRGLLHPIYMVRIFLGLNLSPSENDRDLCHAEVLQFVESMRHDDVHKSPFMRCGLNVVAHLNDRPIGQT